MRKLRGLTLRELASQAGTTASFISQIERGESGASLSTLVKLTGALGMSLPQLFEGDPPAGIVTKSDEHAELHLNNGCHSKKLLTHPSHRTMTGYLSTLEPGESTGDALYTHGDADEFVFVVSGTLVLELKDHAIEMNVGDTAEFRTDIPHRLSNQSSADAAALIVVSPPEH